MDAWVIWLIVAVVFAVAEVVNLSFYLFPFAIGAAAAAVVGTGRRRAGDRADHLRGAHRA